MDRSHLPVGVRLPADNQGALVVSRKGSGSAVVPGSPAAQAGIRDFDVIRAIDGKPVHDINDVKEWVQQHNVGETMKVTLWRSGKTVDIPVKLQVMPSNYGQIAPLPRFNRSHSRLRPFGNMPDVTPEAH